MSLNACPIATVDAPVEQVWRLLADPARYALRWDAQTRSITPEGPAQPSQQITRRVDHHSQLSTRGCPRNGPSSPDYAADQNRNRKNELPALQRDTIGPADAHVGPRIR
jgi:Polyketide cyclase / dehydrase and lipid transport